MVAVAAALVPIAAFIARIIAAICTKWGFIASTAYFLYSPVKDITSTYRLDKEAEIEADAEREDAIDDICEEEGYTAEECAEYRAAFKNAVDDDKPSFFEEIANMLGVTADTAKYLIVLFIIILLLKG